MTDDAPKIIPFGKYKGRLVDEVLLDDPGYLQWLAGQDWFRAKFNILHQVIINRGAEPEETPDHNAMQVRFLDDEFCLRFLRRYRLDIDAAANKGLQEVLNDRARAIANNLAKERRTAEHEQYWIDNEGRKFCSRERADEARAALPKIEAKIVQFEALHAQELRKRIDTVSYRFERAFEVAGIDVVLRIDAVSAAHDIAVPFYDLNGIRYRGGGVPYLAIEIKPVIGDDYPAVLRQMKRTGANVLFVGEYRGQGATQEQFVKTMATAGIRVMFASELEAAAE